MDVLMAFGVAGIMLLIGMLLRAKVPFIRQTLAPAAVLGGVVGFICMNTFIPSLTDKISYDGYTDIVNILFTVSFISIGLTRPPKKKAAAADPVSDGKKKKKKKRGPLYRGSMGMGLAWCILYSLQGGLGVLIIALIGPLFGMDPIYGMLIPFGYAQGPGQAATNGTVYETTYGVTNASQVAITFAVIGFMAAFLVGVPLAKLGMKRNLPVYKTKINESIARGYFQPSEQHTSMGKATTYSGNVETLAFHAALMGVSYLFGLVVAWLFSFIPVIGSGLSGMMFMNGLIGAYIVNAIVKKLGLDYLQNSTLQSKVTGWASDFLVVMAFMAVQLSSVGDWIVPILVECVIVTAVTAFISVKLSQHLGDVNDFERMLALYGTACGTAPSGLSLVRMVDPNLRTTTGAEMGMMNLPEMFVTISSIVMMLAAAGTIPTLIVGVILLATVPIYFIMMKATGCFGPRTWSFNEEWNKANRHFENVEQDGTRLQGTLSIPVDEVEDAVQSAMA